MARIERGAPVSAERAGGSGRRDPALRRRIQRDEPVYDDDQTPSGVVARRQRDEDLPEEGDYGESIDPADLIDPEREFADIGEGGDLPAPDDVYMLLNEGAVIFAKVTHPVRFDDDPSYFSYGVADRVREDEAEEEAFDRISTVVNTRSLDMAYAAEEHIEALVDRVEARRRERSNNRRGLRPRGSTPDSE